MNVLFNVEDPAERREIKFKCFLAYGRQCYCCGETNPHFLTLDHVNGDGKEDRKRRGSGYVFYRRLVAERFPQDPPLRVACWNCNCAARYELTNNCPGGHRA